MSLNKRKLPEIPTASLADISFLMLIFFLIATTMSTDKGLARMLPPIFDVDVELPPVKERNVLSVMINFRNEVIIKSRHVHVSQIKDITKEFLANPYGLENLPELVPTEVDYFGYIPITKHAVISLQTDRGTQYQLYLTVQNELQAAISELRNEISKKQFGTKYDELSEDQQKAVRVIYPQRISEAEPRNVKKK